MERFTYKEILEKLAGFDAWLWRLGIKARSDDRIHQAIKYVERAYQSTEHGRKTGEWRNIEGGDLFPMMEALEAYEVLKAFGDQSSTQLGSTVQRALSGPLQPINETNSSASRDGRNLWFELALAAEWKLRGGSVEIAEPDLRLYYEGKVFFVACKRPAKHSSIRPNIKGAFEQLDSALNAAPENHYGVAAISVSKVLNAGDKFWSGRLQDLGDRLTSEAAPFERYWRSLSSSPKICAILYHVATPDAGGKGVDLARATYTVAVEVNRSEGSECFGRFARAMGEYRSE